MNGEGRELDWDDEITRDNNLLPVGNYEFEVISFERGRFQGSDKMPACNKAIVMFSIEDNDGSLPMQIRHSFLLHSKTEWMVSGFFRSIGMKKHGETLKMDWKGAIGRRGIAKIGIRTYEGKEYNEIKSFLDPDSKMGSGEPKKPKAQKAYTEGDF